MVARFSGNPKTEWLPDCAYPDRDMALLEDFWYDDPDGRRWHAPTHSVINGASIPRSLWSLVGSPYTDDYRRASVVHDVACGNPAVSRAEADRMFYFACLTGGCSVSQGRLLYVGVRLGAWATAIKGWARLSSEALLFRAPGDLPAEATATVNEYTALRGPVLALPPDASFESLEALVNTHLGLPRV